MQREKLYINHDTIKYWVYNDCSELLDSALNFGLHPLIYAYKFFKEQLLYSRSILNTQEEKKIPIKEELHCDVVSTSTWCEVQLCMKTTLKCSKHPNLE